MNTNEMIERYVHEVGSHLPRKGRDDIQRELHSLVQDAVDERAGGGEPSTEQVAKVLIELGKPEKIANQYHSQQYLIGPALFPIFKQVVVIVPLVLTGVHAVLLALTLWSSGLADSGGVLLNWLGSYVQSILLTVGIITMIFALLERYAADQFGATVVDMSEWDPYKLPRADDPNRIKRGEEIAGVIASLFFLGIFLVISAPGGLLAPFIAESFRPVISWIVASTLLEAALKVIVIGQGHWRPLTRWLEVGTDLFGLFVLYLIFSAETITTIAGLSLLIKFGVGIALVVVSVVLLFQIIQLIWQWQYGSRFDWRHFTGPKAA